MTLDPTIGVLGGMGPAATLDFMSKVMALTPAKTDQEHLPMVVWSDPRVPDRTRAIVDFGSPSPVPLLKQGVARLETLGATVIAIPCNTAHHWFREIQLATKVPILHIADCAIAALLETGVSIETRVGIMGTNGTLASGFYQQRLQEAGLTVVMPSPDVQETLVMPSIRAVKSRNIPLAQDLACRAALLLSQEGADTILLACTELPVAFAQCISEFSFIDATESLARACVLYARPDSIPAPRRGADA